MLSSLACSTYCDDSDPLVPLPVGQALQVTSDLSGLRFSPSELTFTGDEPLPGSITLNMIPAIVEQEIIGWGGSFTDAAAINLKKLDQGAQDLLMR